MDLVSDMPMNETVSRKNHADTAPIDLHCQKRLDALIECEFSEDELIRGMATLRETYAERPWNSVALTDRRYEVGVLPDSLPSFEPESALGEFDTAEYGVTAELHPIPR